MILWDANYVTKTTDPWDETAQFKKNKLHCTKRGNYWWFLAFCCQFYIHISLNSRLKRLKLFDQAETVENGMDNFYIQHTRGEISQDVLRFALIQNIITEKNRVKHLLRICKIWDNRLKQKCFFFPIKKKIWMRMENSLFKSLPRQSRWEQRTSKTRIITTNVLLREVILPHNSANVWQNFSYIF